MRRVQETVAISIVTATRINAGLGFTHDLLIKQLRDMCSKSNNKAIFGQGEFLAAGRLLAGCGLLVLLLLASCSHLPADRVAAGYGDLRVVYQGFRSDQGTAVTYLFTGPKGFPDTLDEVLENRVLPIRNGEAETIFRHIPYGRYAVGVLHDTDGDEVMKKDWMGRPLEGFALSGDPDYSFGRPSFEAASFLLVAPQREITLRLRYQTGGQERRERLQRQHRQAGSPLAE